MNREIKPVVYKDLTKLSLDALQSLQIAVQSVIEKNTPIAEKNINAHHSFNLSEVVPSSDYLKYAKYLERIVVEINNRVTHILLAPSIEIQSTQELSRYSVSELKDMLDQTKKLLIKYEYLKSEAQKPKQVELLIKNSDYIVKPDKGLIDALEVQKNKLNAYLRELDKQITKSRKKK